jgi:hypothetical protein
VAVLRSGFGRFHRELAGTCESPLSGAMAIEVEPLLADAEL